MNLGERCDEIVRLIDETLAGLALDDGDAALSPVTSLTPVGDPIVAPRRGAPSAGPPPDRAVAGF